MLHPTLDALLRALLAFQKIEARVRARGIAKEAPTLTEQVAPGSKMPHARNSGPWSELLSVQMATCGDLRLERTFMRTTNVGADGITNVSMRAGVTLVRTRAGTRGAQVIARAGYRAASDRWYAHVYPDEASERASVMRAILKEEREGMANATEAEALAFVDRMCTAIALGDITTLHLARKN